jgi:hypothetical protein
LRSAVLGRLRSVWSVSSMHDLRCAYGMLSPDTPHHLSRA